MKPAQVVQFKKEKITLKCSWVGCSGYTPSEDVDEFAKHVTSHVQDLQRWFDPEFICQWENCDEAYESAEPLERHLSFHAHQTKLVALGQNLMVRLDLPECQKRTAPQFPWPSDAPSECLWKDCHLKINNIVTFYAHLEWHAMENPRGNNLKDHIKCDWEGCTGTFTSAYKLRDHVKTHSEEKCIACPRCEVAFASRSKLQDHLRRQDKAGAQFKCSHCFKLFPSERILKDHLRRHINYYRCNLCNMTLSSPAAIAIHHRYKHSNARPFLCPYEDCGYAAKREFDFERHVETHKTVANMRCPAENCNSRFSSRLKLEYHLKTVHDVGEKRTYICHICDGKWTRGSRLTQHLAKKHQLSIPDCYNRYSYMRGEDGLYRLQLVRFEALDVADAEEEMEDEDEGLLEVDEKDEVPDMEEDASEESSSDQPEVTPALDHRVPEEPSTMDGARALQAGDEVTLHLPAYDGGNGVQAKVRILALHEV